MESEMCDVFPKHQLAIRTVTKTGIEEDAPIQDFSRIYLLERDQPKSIAVLEQCLTNRKRHGCISLHEDNVDSAKLVLDWIKDGKLLYFDRILADQFVPGTIVWAKFQDTWWPARVSAIFAFSLLFPLNVCARRNDKFCGQAWDRKRADSLQEVMKEESPNFSLVHFFDKWEEVKTTPVNYQYGWKSRLRLFVDKDYDYLKKQSGSKEFRQAVAIAERLSTQVVIGVSAIQPTSLLAALRSKREMGGGVMGEGVEVKGGKDLREENNLNDAAELGIIFYTFPYIYTNTFTLVLYTYIYMLDSMLH